jgi:formylmethanofuran dehydrogenase subunit E-like metal-binding protein
MITIDNIDNLRKKVLSLKVEYDQYFMRIVKREPLSLRDEVEKQIMYLSNQQTMNTSLKFQLNTLVARYNSYKNYWSRTVRAIEEGRYERDIFKINRAEANQPSQIKEKHAAPVYDGEKIKSLYDKYIATRKECDESTNDITYNKLKKVLSKWEEQVKEKYNCSEVDFKVRIQKGKTKIVVLPKKLRSKK